MAGAWVTVCHPPAEAADDNPVERGMWDERRIQGGSDGLGFTVAPDTRTTHLTRPLVPGTPGGLARGRADT